MTLEKSTDSYLLLDQEVKADYEETLFRHAVCSLRSNKKLVVKSLGSRTKMGRLSEKHVELEQKEDLVAKVHLALWPKNDMETFYRLLEEHPEVVNSRFGKCQDTLLHIYEVNQIHQIPKMQQFMTQDHVGHDFD